MISRKIAGFFSDFSALCSDVTHVLHIFSQGFKSHDPRDRSFHQVCVYVFVLACSCVCVVGTM